MAQKSPKLRRGSRKHGKRLTRGVSNTRSKSISMGIQKLIDAPVIDKTAFLTDSMVSFGDELLKLATTDKVDPNDFKITKSEAERAARSLAEGQGPKRVLKNMGTFAALSPAVRSVAKGVAGTMTGPKGGRLSAGAKAMKAALKDKPQLVENAVAGAGSGAAYSMLSESRSKRDARDKVRRYIEESRAGAPTKDKLKAVL